MDPADIVYSYTESPYFDDIYYVGEVRRITISELKKQFPNLTNEELEAITGKAIRFIVFIINKANNKIRDKNSVSSICTLNYKTYMK